MTANTLSERQEQLLQYLIKSYLNSPEPVSSEALLETARLDVSPATVRNDLKELTELGFLEQPHTSAGRVPTKKAYQYFAHKAADREADFIHQQVEAARKQLEKETQLAKELANSLEKISSTLRITQISNNGDLVEMLEIISYSKNSHSKTEEIINDIIKQLGQF